LQSGVKKYSVAIMVIQRYILVLTKLNKLVGLLSYVTLSQAWLKRWKNVAAEPRGWNLVFIWPQTDFIVHIRSQFERCCGWSWNIVFIWLKTNLAQDRYFRVEKTSLLRIE